MGFAQKSRGVMRGALVWFNQKHPHYTNANWRLGSSMVAKPR